ncbi:MAG: cell division protein FtsK [Flavobacteriaceae bacterium]|nr:cell division protein FtsK [Flavobacteriaceae bacterium]|tara:strand:- start:4401 stop:6704 length:2304 start_codon:yes stop_codon:yes gene_type:complete
MKNNSKTILGSFLVIFSLLITISIFSFINTWQDDQSLINNIFSSNEKVENIGNKIGFFVSYYLVYAGFGIGSLLICFNILIIGLSLALDRGLNKIIKRSFLLLSLCIWISIFCGYFINNKIYSGVFGFEAKNLIINFSGDVGLILLLIFGFIVFMILVLKITPLKTYNFIKVLIENIFEKIKITNEKSLDETIENIDEEKVENKFVFKNEKENQQIKPTIENFSKIDSEEEKNIDKNIDEEIEMKVEEISDEERIKSESENILKKHGEYDHTLELKGFKQPQIKILSEHNNDGVITINQEELEENKEKIIDTLKNYKIGIDKIKATIGPTVTLYEIIPEAGIRISKIKSLEDDIALSLSALGIRIIAPIPGKGTIGIEVPNKNRKTVSMKSLISSKKFQDAEMELPLALGKTISNETFVVDLSKMPHLLMAGATGQGKSVGINSIITSLLYKKHPSEIKFILVDPKKVELTLFNKIERHYLAKLPDSDEAIITENKTVIKTLNSLCIEMEQRYDLLKNAMCRNIKEYNLKFKKRKLNPNDGHKFLPYLVLVVDEFADLIMTTGKEVETPIARLAQLARAVGIHLLIATQRPSVNVITGLIKANFPARIAFRVTSKVDSRTILDSGGADQLIGRGDMLFTQGNDLIRLQCGFVDTDEIEKITDIIGSQKGYSDAYILPEFIEEDKIQNNTVNIEDRDPLFREAAEVIVTAQQGSASLIQRKMKLGYNRAGRIIDQLEAAGIVGHFEGSKARSVLVKNLVELDQLLNNE